MNNKIRSQAQHQKDTLLEIGLEYMGLKWLVFLIKPMYLIGMWFGEDQSENTLKTRV
jgi:hypothetical protein